MSVGLILETSMIYLSAHICVLKICFVFRIIEKVPLCSTFVSRIWSNSAVPFFIKTNSFMITILQLFHKYLLIAVLNINWLLCELFLWI